MLIDCTLVNTEVDLYLARLRHLAASVDRFVVTEALVDYRGRPKPAHLLESGALDDIDLPITHIVLDDLPITGRRPLESAAWTRDRVQHDASVGPRESLEPDDVLILADVDEFPSHEACRILRRGLPATCTLEMIHMIGSLNTAARRPWIHPYAAPARLIESAFDGRYANHRPLVLRDAGWHFSYLDLENTATAKLGSIAHEELDRGYLKSPTHLELCAKLGCHPCGTNKILVDHAPDLLPQSITTDPYLSQHLREPRAMPTKVIAAFYGLAVSIPSRQNLTVNASLDRARALKRAHQKPGSP